MDQIRDFEGPAFLELRKHPFGFMDDGFGGGGSANRHYGANRRSGIEDGKEAQDGAGTEREGKITCASLMRIFPECSVSFLRDRWRSLRIRARNGKSSSFSMESN
jgi:hypothetical protein